MYSDLFIEYTFGDL